MPGIPRNTLTPAEFQIWKDRKDAEKRQVESQREQQRQAEIQAGTRQMTGFRTATPVQEACIPHFLGHKDVAVDACTGSGKTLAFVIPIVEKLRRLEEPLKKHQVGAIIISPTRELARQIYGVAAPFCKTVPWLQPLLLTGGSDAALDVQSFNTKGGHVIIGTPGRMTDVMKRSAVLDAKAFEVLVLDEADRLLSMGFKLHLDYIMGRLPKQRRTGLFSATQTDAVEELARAGLRNAVRVRVAVKSLASDSKTGAEGNEATQKTPLGLRITYRVCESTEKLAMLIEFLQAHKDQKIIAFMLTCACVDLYATLLKRLPQSKDLQIHALHGRMKQNQRQATLAAFTSQSSGCLLCTDVAARGLDIPDVEWILQLDPPQDPDSVVHRVGRTARMGRSGSAVLFLMPHELAYVDFLRVKKVWTQVPIEEENLEEGTEDLMSAIRELAIGDREVLEKGIKAFVSFVRGYKEHHCRFIFRLSDLDLGKLAYSCALLQLPRMPEMRKKGGKVEGFEPADINPNDVKFLDKARQKAREKKLAEKAKLAESSKGAAGKTSPSKKAAKQQQQKQTPQVAEKRVPAAKRRIMEDRQDVSDFASDYTLLKKLKKGKLSEEEFEMATGMTDDQPNDVDVAIASRSIGHSMKNKGKGKAFKHFRHSQQKKENFKKRKKSKS